MYTLHEHGHMLAVSFLKSLNIQIYFVRINGKCALFPEGGSLSPKDPNRIGPPRSDGIPGKPAN